MADFAVILVEPKYDGNIGSVARAMKNFGFEKLVLVNPPEIGPEGRKNAMHALDILKKAEKAGSFRELRRNYDFLVATTAKAAGNKNSLRTPVAPEDLAGALEKKGNVGLVFGREDYGLLNDEISECDFIVTIPTNPDYPTLNLAQSVGVILYEITKQRWKKRFSRGKFEQLSAKENEILLKYLNELLEKIYVTDFEKNLARKTFRQIAGRAFISGREAKTMTGLFRRASEKTKTE